MYTERTPHAAVSALAPGDRLLGPHLLRGPGLPRREGTQPPSGVHTAHRGHATPRCGDTLHAGSPDILPALGSLYRLLLHPRLQVLLPRTHGYAAHQGMLHTPTAPTTPNNNSRATCMPHTHCRVRMRLNMRRTAAAPARTTRPPPACATRNCPRYLACGRQSHLSHSPARCWMQIKFALRLRSEPQEEFFGDADQPTARGEYSA